MNYPTFFTLFHSYIFPPSFFLNEKATDVVPVAKVGEMDIFLCVEFLFVDHISVGIGGAPMGDVAGGR